MKKLFPIISASLFCCSAYAVNEVELFPKYQGEIDLNLSPITFTPRKSPFIAVGLSTLAPGLGHAYLGDYKTASGLFGSSTLYAGLCLIRPYNETFVDSNLHLISNTWFYSIYAAYRDVRAYNTADVYSYKMPTETLSELALAPFQWSVMKKPEVWGGLLVDLSLAIGLQFLFSNSIAHSHAGSSFPLLAFPVGIGEESFFRGFLQPALSEYCTPWGGIVISSLAFGAAHIPNAYDLNRRERGQYYSAALPFITLSGIYYGWVSYKNCSLKESVALHSWYDFAIFLASYSLAQSTVLGNPTFAFSIPF